MTKAALRSSLTLWRRRYAFRRRRWQAARKAEDTRRVEHWARLVDKAAHMIRRRENQLTRRRPLRLKAYSEAAHLIGVMEHGGNNAGSQVEKIIRGGGGQASAHPPWCGYFCAYVYKRAGSKAIRDWRVGAVRLWLGIGGIRKVQARPRKGHLVRFTFDHIGMFVKDNGDGTITSIEGNTGASGAVSDSTTGGDGVYRKVRSKSLVQDYLAVRR